MSMDPHEVINVRDLGIGDDQHPPQSAPNQTSHGLSNFVDGSGPIFSMYLETATEEDKKMAENWKADADGILIFTGLFSAAVASLISVTIQDIRPNPQDTSNFYLANIYQTVANPNPSDNSSSLPSSPPSFSPPNYAIWVNALWFMSLVISITCALLATLLQQWVRRYLKVTQPRYSPHKRARIRAFFFEGIDKYLISWVVDALPTLLHVSLYLFFGGLVVFLCNVDLTIFRLVLSWVGICTAVYGCFTFIPIFCHDSPYTTPLTLLAWPIVTGISYVIFRVLVWFTGFNCFTHETYGRFLHLRQRYRRLFVQGMLKSAEETALNSHSGIDTRAFMWTFDSLDEDHELERFFSGLPGFRSSKVVEDPLPGLTEKQKWKLFAGLIGLSDRTSSSNLLPEPIKKRRAIICANAIDPALTPSAFNVLDGYFSGPLAAEIVRFVGDWSGNWDGDTTLVVRAAVCSTIARVQTRDDSWFVIASRELGVPEAVLRDYAAHGDNLSLAILIHITRQQFIHFREGFWPWFKFSKIIETASKFNVRDTSPELQHAFCALWNQIVVKMQNDSDPTIAWSILGRVRDVYIALHRDTNSALTQFPATPADADRILFDPTSYPVCSVLGHIHGDSASITFPHIAALASASLASPGAPSPSIPVPLHVDEKPTDVSPLDNGIDVPGSSHPAHQTPTENLRIPTTSPDVIQGDIDTSITTIPPSILEPSASTFPPTSLAPTSSGDVQHITDRRDSPDVLDVPSLLFPTPVLDNMRPMGPQSYPTTGSDHASSPESRSPLVASATSGSSRPRLSSATDIGATAQGEGSTKAPLRGESDALGLLSAIRENIMAAPDLPPQSLSSSLVTDTAIADPSQRSFGAEIMGGHPPDPSYSRYDVV